MKKAIIYTIEFLAIQLIVSYAIMGIYRLVATSWSSLENMQMLVIVTIVANLLITLLFIKTKWAPVSRQYIQSRPWAVLFWTTLAALGALLPSLWLQENMPQLPNLIEEDLTMMVRTPGGFLALAILAPVAEELVFRGAVLHELLKSFKNHWVAIAISALLFMLVHMNPAQMPHAFIIGLLLGWLFYRTNSVLPGMLFHVVNNAVAYILERLYPSADNATMQEMFGGNERAVALAVAFSLLILLPSLFQLHARMKRPQ